MLSPKDGTGINVGLMVLFSEEKKMAEGNTIRIKKARDLMEKRHWNAINNFKSLPINSLLPLTGISFQTAASSSSLLNISL